MQGKKNYITLKWFTNALKYAKHIREKLTTNESLKTKYGFSPLSMMMKYTKRSGCSLTPDNVYFIAKTLVHKWPTQPSRTSTVWCFLSRKESKEATSRQQDKDASKQLVISSYMFTLQRSWGGKKIIIEIYG